MDTSLRTLKRRLRELGLNRGRGNIINDQMPDDMVQNELATSLCHGLLNQRIEALWSRLLRYRLRWWIDVFQTMGGDGLYHGELLIHKELMLFCFMSALQYELNEFKEHWNAKWIRQSAEAPALFYVYN